MMNFRPPRIKKRDLEYEVKDILVLNELDKRPTYVREPLKTFSGYSHKQLAENNYIDFKEVVESLRQRNLIRESYTNEIIDHLTNTELKVILRNINQRVSGRKEELVKRIELNASDEDIRSNIDKGYFVITDLGYKVLNKYKNVVWILENEEFIFNRSLDSMSRWMKFNEYYFMEHWDVDPVKTMIDYYKPRNSTVVARIYQIADNKNKFFYYSVKQLSEDINSFLEILKRDGISSMDYKINRFQILMLEAEEMDLKIGDKNLENILNEFYGDIIKDKTLISFDIFKELITSILNNENYLYNQLIEELSNCIRKSFTINNQNNHNNEDFYNYDKNTYEKDTILNILDLVTKDDKRKEEMILELIDEIDLDMVKRINEKLIINRRNYNT